MRCYNKGTICFPECEDVFCFDKVSCVTFAVQTSRNKAPTHPTSIFPWYQYKCCWSVDWLNLHEAINHWHSERRILNLYEFFEQLVIEGKLVDIVDAGWKASSQILNFRGLSIHHFFNSTLQALRQVNGVWKVERTVFLECFKHRHKLLVLLSTAYYKETNQSCPDNELIVQTYIVRGRLAFYRGMYISFSTRRMAEPWWSSSPINEASSMRIR